MKLLTLIFLALSSILQAGDLKFEKDLQEANISLKDSEVTREFKFTNTGSKEIKIKHVDPGCTCVTVEFLNGKSTYAAGESGVLRATFKIDNAQGVVDKNILIWLAGDSDEKPSSQVTFRIHIPIAIALEPKTLNWDINSKPEPKFIRVNINYEKPVLVKAVKSSSENFTAEIVTVEEGKTYDIRVTPKSTAAVGLCVIGIETDIEIEKYRSQQGFARVSNPKTHP
ncbi:MAG: DUF1573 domain-containing protein [Verrucomicrobiota bacterium]